MDIYVMDFYVVQTWKFFKKKTSASRTGVLLIVCSSPLPREEVM